MKTKHYLTLTDADVLMNRAIELSYERGFNMSISIVDDAGALMMMKRMDGATPLTAHLSLEKAKCSAMSRRPSKFYEDIIRNGQMGFLTLESVSGMLEGGEPIIYEGQLIGAIGISGAKAFEDADIAQTTICDFFQQI
ncbi:GlcG/HbpS family heme-binding protein [Acinetobacter ihumii]|uniref:GlcG/HbpS family heme-binding protein n=1 Tax=Acinetobacter ihumii TaxID=2483802 RepID=UPI00102F7C46|nr:heme-binding protein [Acinetobacter ihumii]